MPGQDPRVEALGTSGAPAPHHLTTTFRFSGDIVVDTGAATHAIDTQEREQLQFVFLSHAHLDHTLGLPFLLADAQPRVYGLHQTLEVVRKNLLDGHIWPDLSDRATWHKVVIGDTVEASAWQVEVGPANHTVPCVSYLFRQGDYSIAIIGDTRFDDTVAAWVAERLPTACVVEVSYANRVAAMARRFGHQTAADIRGWRSHLGRECTLYVTHIKPDHMAEVRRELAELDDPALEILQDGTVIRA